MRKNLTALLVLALVTMIAAHNSSPAAPPKFRQVGIAEGFYGKPWSHQDRIDMLEFMAAMGMNTYYYAPKADPYRQEKWRETYPAEYQDQFRELLSVAGRYKITLYFALSPGLTMSYREPGDFEALRAKFDGMINLGFAHFALFFDDVLPVLADEQDRTKFGSLASAHALVINKTREYLLSKGADLVVCPMTYTNAWGDRGYLKDLGKSVEGQVPFFWAGIDAVAPAFTSAQAKQWAEIMSRQPLIWDNYPANDFAPWRVFLGPWRGRAPDLPEASAGIISNPMSQAHASMIPLATLAEYARDPVSYSPDRAMPAALTRLFGSKAAERMRPLLETYGSYEWEAGLFEPLYIPGEAIQGRAILGAVRRVRDTLASLKTAAFRSDKRLNKIVAELEPVVEGTGRKLLEYVNNPSYQVEGDHIVYRSELDRIAAGPLVRPVQVDGRLSEWPATGWRSLVDPKGGASNLVEAAFMHDAVNLYIGMRARAQTAAAAPDPATSGSARKVIVVVDTNPSGTNSVNSEDPILRYFVERGSKAEVWAFQPSPLMAKLMAGSAGLDFESLLERMPADRPGEVAALFAEKSSFAAIAENGGFEAELALPAGGRKRVRLALVVVDPQVQADGGYSLASRNYPLNPSTFAEIELN